MIDDISDAMSDEAWEAVGLRGYSKAREEKRNQESWARVSESMAASTAGIDDGLD
jgi:hypothetical protein